MVITVFYGYYRISLALEIVVPKMQETSLHKFQIQILLHYSIIHCTRFSISLKKNKVLS